jgi:hypothetical protein
MFCSVFVQGFLCNDEMVVRGKFEYEKANKSENFLGKIKSYYQPKWFMDQAASWNNRYKPVFTEVLTKLGYGSTFNMLPESKLFTKEYEKCSSLLQSSQIFVQSFRRLLE